MGGNGGRRRRKLEVTENLHLLRVRIKVNGKTGFQDVQYTHVNKLGNVL